MAAVAVVAVVVAAAEVAEAAVVVAGEEVAVVVAAAAEVAEVVVVAAALPAPRRCWLSQLSPKASPSMCRRLLQQKPQPVRPQRQPLLPEAVGFHSWCPSQ